MQFKASQIENIGIKVTTVCKLGGVGIGYVLPDECYKDKSAVADIAWQSCGNGWYAPHEFAKITKDNGQGYIDTIRSMGFAKA